MAACFWVSDPGGVGDGVTAGAVTAGMAAAATDIEAGTAIGAAATELAGVMQDAELTAAELAAVR